MSNINDFLHTLRGKINSFISSIIEYSDDKNKKPLDDIKFPFVKLRNISASKIKSQAAWKSYLRSYFPEKNTHTFDYFENAYLPKRNNTFDKTKIIYKEINLSKSFLGKKTYRKNPTFEIKEFSNANVNNIYKIQTVNTSKEKIIKNYNEKVEPKYYKRNENKIHNIKINYDNLKKFSESKKYKKDNIIERNDIYNGNENVHDYNHDNVNIYNKKIFKSDLKMNENKEIKNNNINSDNENENENINDKSEKSDEIIVKEKEIDLNIYDSFVSHKNNKFNSFISLNTSRVFNNELMQDYHQSFSLNLSEIKKNNNQKSNFICQKQNEFSYKVSNDKNDENKEINLNKEIKKEAINEEIKINPINGILEKKETVKSIFENNNINIFNKEKSDSSINQNSLTNKTKDSTLFKENKNESLFGKKIEKSEKKLNLFGAEENSGIIGNNSLFSFNSQISEVKKDKMKNDESKGGLFGNLNNSGNNISLFGNNLNNKNSLFGSNDGNKNLFGKVENGSNKSLFS